ncbi:MAG: ComF family protein [Bacillota bacterium]
MNIFKKLQLKIKALFASDLKAIDEYISDDHQRKYALTETLGSYRHICPECGKEMFNDDVFCEECSKLIVMLSGDKCPKCGRKVMGNVSCNICRTHRHDFDRAFTAFNYEGIVVKYILNMKFYGKAYLYHMFAKYLAYVYLKSNIEADFVSFVPMTKKGQKQRGYNQSELLAKEFSYLTGIPLFYGVIKKRETKFQKRLNAEDRRKNMQDVFRVEGDIKNKNILVIDDVMTTGATLDSVAKALKRSNASKIYAITIAATAEKFAKK